MAGIKTAFCCFLIVGNLHYAVSAGAAGVKRPVEHPVSGRPATPEGITPADVLARVKWLSRDVDRVRQEMGKPELTGTDLPVREVVPREVIFQALTLFGKTNQLSSELTGNRKVKVNVGLPPVVLPYHVWLIVNRAHQDVLDIKMQLGIRETDVEEVQPPEVTSTDVFHAIIHTNKQLNDMIQLGPESVNVLNHVVSAVGYAVRLLQFFPEANLDVGMPEYERRKKPADVHELLLENYSKVSSIISQSGFPVMKLRRENSQHRDSGAPLLPGDVYDVAVLIASELSYLQSQVFKAKPPAVAKTSGITLPSQVHQTARVLLRLLAELETQVTADPGWVENSRQIQPAGTPAGKITL